MIRNLINNAFRHTPSGTPITLRAATFGPEVRIDVADAGPGIDPADQARILEKYGRGPNAKSDGRGLGLYLSRRILQAHGACFSFCLKEST